jgi:hypothetical protein
VVDALLLPNTDNGGPPRLWAALANDGLAFADLTAAAAREQQGQQRQQRRLTRLWASPASIDEEARGLLPSPTEAAAAVAATPPPFGGSLLLGASAGSAFSDQVSSSSGSGSNKDAVLRQQLWALHQELGGGWAPAHRHIEAGFLRLLAAPHRYSSLGLSKAMERFSSSPATTAGAAGPRASSPTPGGSGSQQDDNLVGERLWDAVAACVRREADAEMERRRLQGGGPGGVVGPEAAAFVEGERRARALWGAWRRFVAVAEESKEVLGQPLGLVAPLLGAGAGKEDPALAFGPLVVRYVSCLSRLFTYI